MEGVAKLRPGQNYERGEIAEETDHPEDRDEDAITDVFIVVDYITLHVDTGVATDIVELTQIDTAFTGAGTLHAPTYATVSTHKDRAGKDGSVPLGLFYD